MFKSYPNFFNPSSTNASLDDERGISEVIVRLYCVLALHALTTHIFDNLLQI